MSAKHEKTEKQKQKEREREREEKKITARCRENRCTCWAISQAVDRASPVTSKARNVVEISSNEILQPAAGRPAGGTGLTNVIGLSRDRETETDRQTERERERVSERSERSGEVSTTQNENT